MTRASDERRLALVEQRAVRLPHAKRISPEVTEFLAGLSAEQLAALERVLELILGTGDEQVADQHSGTIGSWRASSGRWRSASSAGSVD